MRITHGDENMTSPYLVKNSNGSIVNLNREETTREIVFGTAKQYKLWKALMDAGIEVWLYFNFLDDKRVVYLGDSPMPRKARRIIKEHGYEFVTRKNLTSEDKENLGI